MRINIKSTMPMPEIPSELELETGSLRDLFAKVFGKTYFAKQVIDPKTGDVALEGILNVSINGIPYHSLEQGLDTALHDGDTITISVIMLGGG
jgi:hypothetical protein